MIVNTKWYLHMFSLKKKVLFMYVCSMYINIMIILRFPIFCSPFPLDAVPGGVPGLRCTQREGQRHARVQENGG